MRTKFLLSLIALLISISFVSALPCGIWKGFVSVNSTQVNGSLVTAYDGATGNIVEYKNPYDPATPFGNYSIKVKDESISNVLFKIGALVINEGIQACNSSSTNYLDLTATDLDSDGYANVTWGYTGTDKDCDDSNPNINPGVAEVPGNFMDDDCNAFTYDWDADGDGYNGTIYNATAENGIDCDDTNPAIHPGATEVCGNGDENCDGNIDEGCSIPPGPGQSYSSGGGGGGGGCTPQWTCTEWSECASDGTQTRTCTNAKPACNKNKPNETQSCTYIPPAPTGEEGLRQESEPTPQPPAPLAPGITGQATGIAGITGAFIGTAYQKTGAGLILFALILGILYYAALKKRKKK